MQRVDFASQRLIHPAARLQAQSDALAALALRLVRAARNAHRDWQRAPAAFAKELGRRLCQPLPQRLAVDRARERWLRSADRRVAVLDAKLVALQRGLRHLGPQAVLERGYSIVTTAEGDTVQDVAQLALGDHVRMQFARGRARAEIEERDTRDLVD